MNLLRSLFFVVVFLAFSSETLAANLYLEPTQSEVGLGGTQIVKIRLDTNDQQCINAVDAVMYFDDGLVVEDVSVGNSIFNFWVEPPTFNNESNTVTFAGGIPNGYCGRIPGDPTLTNTLAEVVFRVDANYSGEELSKSIYFDPQTKGYLNDGRGTAIGINPATAKIIINPEYVGGEEDEWLDRVEEDNIAPKSFSITLDNDKSIFNGQHYVVFNTNDKQTGLDHYEVYEEPLTELEIFGWGAATTPWINAVSPYKLSDQSLNSTIYVKAVDKAGNEYIATLVPDKSIRGLDENAVILYGLLLLFLSVVTVAIWYMFHLMHARQRRLEVIRREDKDNNLDENYD